MPVHKKEKMRTQFSAIYFFQTCSTKTRQLFAEHIFKLLFFSKINKQKII